MRIRHLLPLFLLLATLSRGTDKPTPPPATVTHLTPAEIDRIYCQPRVIDAMKKIFMDAGDGTKEWEASFEVSNKGTVFFNPIERDRPDAQTVFIWPDTVAIFHTHPHGMMWPSTPDNNVEHNGKGDTGLADEFKIDIYVVTNLALTRYRPGVGNSIERNEMDWAKACPR